MNRRTLIGLIAGTAVCLAFAGAFMPAGAQDSDPGTPAPNSAIAPAAQAGTAFTFQGQLKKNGGAFSGACSFQFTLFDAAAGGAQVDTPRTVNATVTNGLFTAQLDFGNQFTGQARWLETAVKCGGDSAFIPQSPRLSMTASPYAIGLIPGAVVRGGSATAAIIGESQTFQGVVGRSAATFSAGIQGENSSSGPGVTGYSSSGAGVQGNGSIGVDGTGQNSGVRGTSENGAGVYGASSNASAVFGESQNFQGVVGRSHGTISAGVQGENDNSGPGVRGYSTSNAGVWGTSDGAFGVYGESANNYAIK
ncbi:MAG: hypothetical protein ACJ8CR_39430, partial [Roseiflexaceae bacterium]